MEDDDGTRIDVTEGVQVCYDACTSSLDWGSGFLATDEARAIQVLAVACGFDQATYENAPCTCGHSDSWHDRWSPSGVIPGCAGVRGRSVVWDPKMGPAVDRCPCPALQVTNLPTRDALIAATEAGR